MNQEESKISKCRLCGNNADKTIEGNPICNSCYHSIVRDLDNATNVLAKKKIGRNDKCPCLSGLKYKKCCGNEIS